jgi:hypothetical protein
MHKIMQPSFLSVRIQRSSGGYLDKWKMVSAIVAPLRCATACGSIRTSIFFAH